METRNADMRANVRDDERRRREEASIIGLQQQVDELRHTLREQVNRQGRIEEQLRQSETQAAQLRAELNDARQEAARFGQLRQLDEQRLRQQLTDLQARVEEPQRPLRNLQAQMAELADQVRQTRESLSGGDKQVDTVRAQIESYRTDIARALEIARQTRESIEGSQQAHTTLAREVQRSADQARLVEQDVRRKLAEIEQSIGNFQNRIDEVALHRPALEEMVRQAREEYIAYQPQIDALRAVDEQQAQTLARVQVQAEDRATLIQGRLEEMRTALSQEIERLVDAGDDAINGLHTRIGEWEEVQRDLSSRLGQAAVQISGLQARDERLLEVLRRAEERLIRQQLEQAQATWEDLMERRQAENEEDR